MIKLTKLEEPAILNQNAANWTKAVTDKLDRGEQPTKAEMERYRHADIKTAIVAETHGKCAYCESKLRHITYGDIEHIVPKSVDPRRRFEWNNLTLACDVCNTLKSDYVGDHGTFIDPYAVDPEEHFLQFGATVCPKPGCDAAAKTERLLNLNRPELVERRLERLKSLMRQLDIATRAVDPDLKDILLADFLEETKAEKEYVALAREVLRQAKTKLNQPWPRADAVFVL